MSPARPDIDATLARIRITEEVADAVRRIEDLVLFVLPKYEHELKAEVTIAMGCTGGRHRSVYLANRMAQRVGDAGYDVVVHHRDKDRWRYS